MSRTNSSRGPRAASSHEALNAAHALHLRTRHSLRKYRLALPLLCSAWRLPLAPPALFSCTPLARARSAARVPSHPASSWRFSCGTVGACRTALAASASAYDLMAFCCGVCTALASIERQNKSANKIVRASNATRALRLALTVSRGGALLDAHAAELKPVYLDAPSRYPHCALAPHATPISRLRYHHAHRTYHLSACCMPTLSPRR